MSYYAAAQPSFPQLYAAAQAGWCSLCEPLINLKALPHPLLPINREVDKVMELLIDLDLVDIRFAPSGYWTSESGDM